MKTSLKKRVLIFTFFALLIPLGLSVIFDVQAIFASYRKSLTLRLQIQAESLSAEVEKVLNLGLPLEEMEGLSSRCQELVQRDPDLAYCIIESQEGGILFAHDPSLVGHHNFPPVGEDSPQLLSGFRDWGVFYDVNTSVQNATKKVEGKIRLGFLRSVLLDMARDSILRNLFIFLMVFGAVYLLILVYLQKHLMTPVNKLCQVANRLTEGDFESEMPSLESTEFQTLSDNLGYMASSLAERDKQIVAGMEELEHSNLLLQGAYEEQEKISGELKQNQMLYQSLVDEASEAIIVCNDSDEIQLFNRQAVKFFNVNDSEVIGMNLLGFFQKIGVSSVENLYEMYQSVVECGVGAEEFSFFGEDSLERTGLVSAVALKGVYGESLIQLIIHDITHEHQAKLNLEKSAAQLTRLNHMKNTFLGMVSHELKTPLTIILGYADLLETQKETNLDPILQESLGHIINAAERLGRIIQDMVDASDLDGQRVDLKLKSLDVNQLLVDCSDKLQQQTRERKQHISLDLDARQPKIQADSSRLQQMLEHLVVNAIKFTPDNGRILLKSIFHPQDSPVTRDSSINGDKSAGCVEIIVADDGIGVPHEEHAHIFDKFYGAGPIEEHSSSRVSFKGKGVGLGLAIVQGIVELHGGEIWIDKEHNSDSGDYSGSAFHVRLPVSPSLEL